ncbi:hypothetical protein COEREDRAFT_81492 [Coemansia reversa NRRL 1564]|uniref:Cysteine-rich transmembrane CYSTM domain-containing protein n=1 Tax=Coemansia reversa (strain ATCC 12441 / NRRL 1564) TaxID=763665 RepID=A0A2G5BAM1_COERN|nr:hypothetical protein COEREDRAFT_81492 [Coemansia reversa NRRL 1564]|eukprot:PIA16042.1 hypothetical protein COEREDRAFT_81492 [Coemansia reversa NRRL 1564]
MGGYEEAGNQQHGGYAPPPPYAGGGSYPAQPGQNSYYSAPSNGSGYPQQSHYQEQRGIFSQQSQQAGYYPQQQGGYYPQQQGGYYPQQQGGYYAPAPQAVTYSTYPQQNRGSNHGFMTGCLAAMCACCCLDMIF